MIHCKNFIGLRFCSKIFAALIFARSTEKTPVQRCGLPNSSWADTHDLFSKSSVIITPKIERYLREALHIGVSCGGHPLCWNKLQERSELGSERQQRLWRFNMILAFCHLSFLYFRWIQTELELIPATKYQKIFTVYLAACYSLGAVLHLGVIQKTAEINAHVNMYLHTVQNFERRYVAKHSKPPKIIRTIEVVMQLVSQSFQLVWFAMTILSLVRYRSLEQISSLFLSMDPQSRISVVAILNAAFMAHINYLFYSSGAVIFQTALVSVTCLTILTELNPNSSAVTTDTLRRGKSLVRNLNWFVLVMNFTVEIYATRILPAAQVLVMTCCVLSTYGTVKSHGILSVVLGFMSFFSSGSLVILFTLLAEFRIRSLGCKNYWKGLAEADPWLQKTLKATPAVSFKIGGTYFVDRKMVMTMIYIIFSETVTFLLLNP